MSDQVIQIAVGVYAAVAIITFGHAYNNIDASKDSILMGASGCAVVWPLYWSVKVFEKAPGLSYFKEKEAP